MIEPKEPLSLSRQCALLGVSRSSLYYRPKGESAENLGLMRRMDELHMNHPFYGSRQMMRHLRREGVTAGRHRIRRLNAPHGDGGGLPSPAHERGELGAPGLPLPAARPRDLPGGPRVVRGHHLCSCQPRVFLPGGRDGLGDRAACACVAAVQHDGRLVLHRSPGRRARPGDSGDPEYRDQGSQFTSAAFADRVLGAGVAFSMDGRGRFLDSIFIERLWRLLKYEAVYLHELRDGLQAERIVGSWIDFYNEVRPHSSLGGRTPGETYRKGARAG